MRLPLPSLAAVVFVSGCSVPPQSPSVLRAARAPVSEESTLARGEALYDTHCAVCHGVLGRGDGEAARYLFPPPRRFTDARFRLVSAENGAPFERDLVATLRRGMPGSAMPAWSWLPEGDLSALAVYVRFLAVEGLEADLAAHAGRVNDPLLLQEARHIAEARMTPDRPLPEPPEPSRDAADRARGKALFQQHCAQCHAADGTGEPDPRYDEDGTLNWARDLTAGFLKGGDSPRALACRIGAGMPGTAMPPTDLDPGEESALLAFLRELVPPGTADRLVHQRGSLTALRVPLAPIDPDDPGWSGADEIAVVLAPLRWNDEAVLGAQLAALHDGALVALRLSWPDETGVVRVFSDTMASDAAALQLSSAAQPALFGMGAPDEPTNLWHWQALRVEDVAGVLELLDPTPHAARPTRPGEVRTDVPLYRRLLARLEPSERVDRIHALGVSAVAGATRTAGEVEARARWQDGRWSVVFRRALRASEDTEVALAPGRTLQLACAVWNGAAGDSGAQKSISIWQALQLAP